METVDKRAERFMQKEFRCVKTVDNLRIFRHTCRYSIQKRKIPSFPEVFRQAPEAVPAEKTETEEGFFKNPAAGLKSLSTKRKELTPCGKHPVENR